MKANSPFATEIRIAVECLLDATATEDKATRAHLLKNADLALGRAMNFAEAVDETNLVRALDKYTVERER